MKHGIHAFVFSIATVLLLLSCNGSNKPAENESTAEAVSTNSNADPLPSWNEGPNKKAIIDFVKNTTTEGTASFVKPEDRIATFDNDGTLWCEQPMYFQFLFAVDRIKAMAPQHPEWKTKN